MLDHIVFLIVPIYNTDGNERMAAGQETAPAKMARHGRTEPQRPGMNLTATT